MSGFASLLWNAFHSLGAFLCILKYLPLLVAFWGGVEIDDVFQDSGIIRKWLPRNKVGWWLKEVPFTSSSNRVNSMWQLLSKSRSQPHVEPVVCIFSLDQRSKRLFLKYFCVWLCDGFIIFAFSQVFPLPHLSQLMLPIWHFPSGPDCYKSFCCFQPQILQWKRCWGMGSVKSTSPRRREVSSTLVISHSELSPSYIWSCSPAAVWFTSVPKAPHNVHFIKIFHSQTVCPELIN